MPATDKVEGVGAFSVPKKKRDVGTYAEQKGIPRPRHSKPGEGIVGSALLSAALKRGEELEMKPEDVAKEFGLAYSTLRSLANGNRKIPGLDRRIIERIARFIGIPVAQAFVMAEILKVEDFFDVSTLDQKLDAVYDAMTEDPVWRGNAPKREVWNESDQSMRLLVALLYERTVRTHLLDKAVVAAIE